MISLETLKLISYVLLALLCITAARSTYLGLRLATDGELRKPYKSSELRHKKWSAWGGLVLLLLLVIVVEYTVRLTKPDHTAFAWFHIFLGLSLAIVMTAVVLWKNGLRDPRLHKRFAYACLSLLAAVAVTGVMLMHGLQIPT